MIITKIKHSNKIKSSHKFVKMLVGDPVKNKDSSRRNSAPRCADRAVLVSSHGGRRGILTIYTHYSFQVRKLLTLEEKRTKTRKQIP